MDFLKACLFLILLKTVEICTGSGGPLKAPGCLGPSRSPQGSAPPLVILLQLPLTLNPLSRSVPLSPLSPPELDNPPSPRHPVSLTPALLLRTSSGRGVGKVLGVTLVHCAGAPRSLCPPTPVRAHFRFVTRGPGRPQPQPGLGSVGLLAHLSGSKGLPLLATAPQNQRSRELKKTSDVLKMPLQSQTGNWSSRITQCC